jgi:hypothetical protein
MTLFTRPESSGDEVIYSPTARWAKQMNRRHLHLQHNEVRENTQYVHA